ncbi:MAG: sensor histidine kinase [Acidimicrobiales bacterium]
MGRLVEDLMLLARMDEGLPLHKEPVELVAIAAEAVDAARAVGPDWPLRMESGGPVEMEGDRVGLRQVVDNLLANVRAHTPAGTTATVTVGRRAGQVVCVVADDGPGISAEGAEAVFERFFRADPSRSRSSGGAGLGLSIVAAIVGGHGGRVRAAPVSPHGFSVTFELPVDAADTE